ncbi:MAG: hypothetical protein J6Z08_06800, partial [Elusimicrobiales bacterium]|nr:hypothetical protein [Elusimicrobiales bacterium]
MNILKEKYGKIAKCCALFAAFVVLLISPVITTAANYPYILPDVEDFTTVDNIDTTITVLPEQERMSIWGTGIRNTVTGNVTLTIAGTAEDPLEVTVGSGAPAIYVDGVYGNVYYSKNYITSASYLNIPEGDLPAGFESTTSLIQGNLTLDLSNVIVNDNVIGNQSISEGGNTGNFGTRGKTLIILNNSIVLGDLRGGNDAGLGADPANAPYTTLGDIELNVINSRVEDEIVSVGAYLSAGNILINITGNSIVGDENGEKAAGEDGWVIAGTQRPGGTVGNTEINLDTDGAENTILIAGDVNAGSRYNAVAEKNSDEGSVTGNAALNITGGGNVNIGGDVRAYHVAGTTSLSLENVTATVAGTIQEFGTITVDSDSVLNASAIINSGSFTNNGLVSSALDNTGTITGTGALVFNGDSANAASKTIAQSTITVNEGITFDNNGTASAAIINNGTISGTGTLNTLTASINNGSISQGTIGVSGKFTNNSGKNITVTSGISAADSDALIENYGTITFDASGNALTNDVSITDGGSWVLVDDDYVWTPSGSGSGTVRFVNGHEGENRIVTNTADITQTTVYVDATSYVLNTATITAGEIIVEQGGYLQADLNHITGKITNDEDFVVDSDGELNDPTYIIGDGTTTIHSGATLINNSTISQERIVIEENAGLSSDASSLNANDVIDNNGLLTFTGGTNNNNIESSLNTGGVIIDGEVDNAASVEQSTITVLAGSVFTNTGASSVITGTVYSSGTFTSDVEKMHGDVYNYSMNTYNVNVTGAQDLDGDILGTGRTVITGLTPDIATDVLTVGTHIIEQDKVEIASATVVSNADNLIVTEIANEGLLNLIGGTISSDITGTGAVTISSNSVVNSGSITQNVLTINSELTSDASALSIANGIVNNGTLNFNGG